LVRRLASRFDAFTLTDMVVVEHSGRNELPDGRRYDNKREYMDTKGFGYDLRR
jgi:hypothetical protein